MKELRVPGALKTVFLSTFEGYIPCYTQWIQATEKYENYPQVIL